MHRLVVRRAVALAVAGAVALLVSHSRPAGQEKFRFHTGVELINVTATVTDRSGRFVSGLAQTDFVVYEDDQPVQITHFNAERVPVSLGIVLDTSGSMRGQKIAAARAALDRFLFDLLGPEDEFFLYRFDNTARLVEGWTTDRDRISAALRRMQPDGATALYDGVAEALPLLQSGRHRKKALLVISDGIDTNSRTDLRTLKQLIRESEALVYAIGIDSQTTLPPFGGSAPGGITFRQRRGRPIPLPFPIPGRRTPPRNPPIPGVPPGTGNPRPPGTPPPNQPGNLGMHPSSEGVNVAALRDITDDSGGRTEIVRDTRDLNPATAGLADELSKQYYLGYPSPGHRDGRWHVIRVEVRGQSLRVRARGGYIATS
jgi:VWFA-related protein